MQLLPQYDAFTNLKILSKIKKIASDNDILDSISRVGLENFNSVKVSKFSLGMKQRLNIAQAILKNLIYCYLMNQQMRLMKKELHLFMTFFTREKKELPLLLLVITRKILYLYVTLH